MRLLPVVAAVAGLGLVLLYLRRAARHRSAGALGPFLRHFEAEGVPPEVGATAFRQLRRWMEAQDRTFAVRPDQSLVRVYGLVPEEIDAALERMAHECGRRRDPAHTPERIETVGDLVRELACWPEA